MSSSSASTTSTVNTRGAVRKAKIQTRSIAKEHSDRKPSAALMEAKLKARQKFKNIKNNNNNTNKNNGNKDNDIIRDIYHIAMNTINMIKGDTGIIYDERMTQHYCLWDKGYPECPERFSSVIDRCRELKLFERCIPLQSRSATVNEILIQHTQEQYDLLKETSKWGDDEDKLEDLSSKYDAIYIHPTSFDLSLLSVGCTIELIDNILLNKIQNGMAIIRPPGHHAMKSEYNGYCFFNNVAISAKHALDTYDIDRILIVDWDIHHGQATQRMFYDDPRVLYFSIHRYENGTFWPNLRESDFDYIGDGNGIGYNFNVPLNQIAMSNVDYLSIFQQILMPVATEFQPQLVIISAGYDAAYGCPEFCPDLVIISSGYDSALGDEKGEMEVTPACYSHFLSPLLTLAEGKVAVVLEGGYCLESLSEGAALTLKTLLGDPCPLMEPLAESPCESVQKSILNCIYAHRPFWKCLQIQETYSDDDLINEHPLSDFHKVVQCYKDQPPRPERFATRACYPIQSDSLLNKIAERLGNLKITTNLNYPSNRVCYVYDGEMMEHRNIHVPGHPEHPARIEEIERRFNEYKLIERMKMIKSRLATVDELCLVHDKEHVNIMARTVKQTNLQEISRQYNSVYLHPKTFECAKLAAGSVLEVIDNVLNGESRSGVCIIRPPGHHAEAELPHGFCIFNNVAIGAKYAIECHGLKRVLIIDWDVHHGNGTQHIFETNSNVLYISLHRYDYGNFFPKSTDADYTVVGYDNGLGFTVNIPWNKKGMGDTEYITAFQRIIMPIAYEFNPELVLVSAGFDAAIGDPLGGCKVTPEAYGYFTHWLSALANGRIILCLEGGYNLNTISYAMTMCTKTLLGDPLPSLQNIQKINNSCCETIQHVLSVQKKYWNSLNMYNKKLPNFKCINLQLDNLNLAFEKINLSAVTCDWADNTTDNISNSCSPNSSSSGGGGYNNSKSINTSNYTDNTDSMLESSTSAAATEAVAGPSNRYSNDQTINHILRENFDALAKEEAFAVVPLKTCPHIDLFNSEFTPNEINAKGCCASDDCKSAIENWICLHCFKIYCGRFINEHMLYHFTDTNHNFTLSLSDLSVWCYECGSYIDNPIFYKYKNLAHMNKFGEKLVWTYSQNDDDKQFMISLAEESD